MASEFPPNDPRHLWQNQPKEAFRMSAEEIRRRVEQHQTRSRRMALFVIALGPVLCVLFARAAWKAEYLVTRAGWAVLSLWSLYNAYQAYRWNWPETPPSDPTVAASLSFYRGELEKRRDNVRHAWRRSGLTFCFLALALVVGPGLLLAMGNPRLLVNMAPFSVLLLVWFVAFLRIRSRQQRSLQEEIDELRAWEQENQ